MEVYGLISLILVGIVCFIILRDMNNITEISESIENRIAIFNERLTEAEKKIAFLQLLELNSHEKKQGAYEIKNAMMDLSVTNENCLKEEKERLLLENLCSSYVLSSDPEQRERIINDIEEILTHK